MTQSIYLEAKALSDNRKYEDVITFLTEEKLEQQNDDALYYLRAQAFSGLSKPQEALLDYSKCISINPNKKLYYQLRGTLYFEDGIFDEAIKDYSKNIEMSDVDDDEAFNELGRCFFAQKLYDEALSNFEKANKIKSSYVYLFNIGLVHYRQHNLDMAVTNFSNVLKADKDYNDAYFYRGCVWLQKQSWASAIQDYDAYISRDPNNPDVFNYRGLCWTELGNKDNALRDYGIAIAIKNDYEQAYENRGNLLLKRKEYDRSINDFSKVIELNDRNENALVNRGLSWFYKNEYHQAIDDFSKAVLLDGADYVAYNDRGCAWQKLKVYDKAIVDFQKAISLQPDYAISYRNLGDLYIELGQPLQAKPNYEKAYQLNGMFSFLLPDINKLRQQFDEEVQLPKMEENETVELEVAYKSDPYFIGLDILIRVVLFILFMMGYLSNAMFILLNIILLFANAFLLNAAEKRLEKKIRENLMPTYKKAFKKIKVQSPLSNQAALFSTVFGFIVSFWYFFHISHHQVWYQYIWVVIKTLAGTFFFLVSSVLAAYTMRYRPNGYRVFISKNANGKISLKDFTSSFPNVLPIQKEVLQTIELEEYDKNDAEIAKLESEVKGINTKVEAYMLESVLLGALAFSGFLAILVSSSVHNQNHEFVATAKILEELFKEIFSANTALAAKTYQQLFNINSLYLLIMFESLLCSIFFILVLTLRLRFSDLSLKMDYLIRITNIFNSKEEELNKYKLEDNIHSTDNFTKRSAKLSDKIKVTLEDAHKLLKEINPIIYLMSLYRNLGIIVFYLILVSSGLYFSGATCFFILIIALFTFLFRKIEAMVKLERIKNYLRRH